MIRINDNYQKLQSTYLFTHISQKVAAYQKAHPNDEIIKLGIGDVTKALPPSCITAMHRAVDELAKDSSFRGYGPEQGYDFLRNIIAETDFQQRGAQIAPDEVFISDGAKCDTGNFQELFGKDISIGVPDPVYPVYVDTNVMAGRTGKYVDGRYEGLTYLESTRDNGFIPSPPTAPIDLIYLCFPNNPTGVTARVDDLKTWVDYARENRSLILFDSAYVEFIRDDSIPQSIFEIEGAREVAVEFRSFSKTAGFTGTRCAYTVIPKECVGYDAEGNTLSIAELWNRRQTTKFNGVSYPVQRAAEAVYSPGGQREIRNLADYYLRNAAAIRRVMEGLSFSCTGGVHSPYIWVDTGEESWAFFDRLLEKAGVVCTPGSGFGKCGEGYIRLSSFNSNENVAQAMTQIEKALG